MDRTFWIHAHGAATHFPIALTFMALALETVAFFLKAEKLRRDLQTAGFYAVILAALGAVAGAVTGLGLCHWRFTSEGLLARHHVFVWMGLGFVVVGAVWRFLMGADRKIGYLLLLILAAASMGAGGYFGAEMVHS